MNIATLPFGAAKTVIGTALKESGIGFLSELAIQLGFVQSYRTELGLPSSFKRSLQTSAAAGAGAGIFGGTAKGIGVAVSKGVEKFGTNNKEFIEALKEVEDPSAAERSVIDVLEQQDEILEVSPLPDTPAGQQEHVQRLAEAVDSISEGNLPEISLDTKEPVDIKPETFNRSFEVVDAADLEIDAATFQFKSGADTEGVLPLLKTQQEWDPHLASDLTLWERADGRRFVADGHQRVNLAKRLVADGTHDKIQIPAFVFREADGYTAERVRAIAAGKNIVQGTGSIVDGAKAMRVDPQLLGRMLSQNNTFVKQVRGLSRLSDDAFGMAINDVIDARYAARIGELVANQEKHASILGVLARTKPTNVFEVDSIINQAQNLVTTKKQDTLFGEESLAENLFLERAKVLDKAQKKIRGDKKLFKSLVENKSKISDTGENILDETANRKVLSDANVLLESITKLANRKGVISDALTEAAKQAKTDANFGKATNQFLERIREAATRGLLDGDSDGAGINVAGTTDTPSQSPNRYSANRTEEAIDDLEKTLEQDIEAQAEDLFGVLEDRKVSQKELDTSVVKHPTRDLTYDEALDEALSRPETFKEGQELTPERIAIHNKIKADIYGTGARLKERNLDIILGPPGAGKSTTIARRRIAMVGRS